MNTFTFIAASSFHRTIYFVSVFFYLSFIARRRCWCRMFLRKISTACLVQSFILTATLQLKFSRIKCHTDDLLQARRAFFIRLVFYFQSNNIFPVLSFGFLWCPSCSQIHIDIHVIFTNNQVKAGLDPLFSSISHLTQISWGPQFRNFS